MVHIHVDFLNPKFKTFFENNIFFFQTQGYQISDRETLKHPRTKLLSFFTISFPQKVWARLNKTLTKTKTKFTYTCIALVVALKNCSRLFSVFPDFISIFQTFYRSGELLGKFQDFFNDSRLCMNSNISQINFPKQCKVLSQVRILVSFWLPDTQFLETWF